MKATGPDATSARFPLVSILIPFLNEARYLARCLRSIQAQTYPVEQLEIIAADGGSTDRSREVIEEFVRDDPRIRLVDNPGRTAAAGLNAGLQHARGELILRVDAHCAIAPDYVERCVEILASRPDVGDVGGPIQPVGETLAGKAIALALRSPFSMGGSPFRYATEPRPVDTVYLGAYRRRDIDAIGGFRSDLAANEDYEFNCRLRAAGFIIWCDPAIRTHTYTRRTLPALIRQYLGYGYWKARLARLQPRCVRPRHLAAPACAGLLLADALLAAAGGPAWPLLTLLAGYLATNLWFTARVSRFREPAWPLTPLVFGLMHLSWGLAFLAGLLAPRPPVAYTARTRDRDAEIASPS